MNEEETVRQKSDGINLPFFVIFYSKNN